MPPKIKNEAKAQWSNDQKQIFIDLWRQRPDLYTNKSPGYINRTRRTILLNEITNELRPSTSITEVKDLMNSMTTNFNASYKRYKENCKSGTGLVDIPKAVKELDFLKDNIAIRPTVSNIMMSDSENNVSELDEAIDNNIFCIEEGNDEEHKQDIEVITKNVIVKDIDVPSKKRKKLVTVDEAFCTALKEMSGKRTEFSIYGEYVANELEKIKNKRLLLQVKKKINNIISDALIEEIDLLNTE